MLISTALLLDSNIRNSACTPAKLPCRRVVEGNNKILIIIQNISKMTILVTFWLYSSSKNHLSISLVAMLQQLQKLWTAKFEITNKLIIKMVTLVLEYLFYLLNYVLLIQFEYISPLQSKQISSLTVNNSTNRGLTVNWYYSFCICCISTKNHVM
jgi:hypothetical protein